MIIITTEAFLGSEEKWRFHPMQASSMTPTVHLHCTLGDTGSFREWLCP